MTFTVWVIAARWLHVLAVSLLFGAAVFPFYGVGTSAAISDRRLCELQRLLRASAILALVSGGFWCCLPLSPALRSLGWFSLGAPPFRVVVLLFCPRAAETGPRVATSCWCALFSLAS